MIYQSTVYLALAFLAVSTLSHGIDLHEGDLSESGRRANAGSDMHHNYHVGKNNIKKIGKDKSNVMTSATLSASVTGQDQHEDSHVHKVDEDHGNEHFDEHDVDVTRAGKFDEGHSLVQDHGDVSDAGGVHLLSPEINHGGHGQQHSHGEGHGHNDHGHEDHGLEGIDHHGHGHDNEFSGEDDRFSMGDHHGHGGHGHSDDHSVDRFDMIAAHHHHQDHSDDFSHSDLFGDHDHDDDDSGPQHHGHHGHHGHDVMGHEHHGHDIMGHEGGHHGHHGGHHHGGHDEGHHHNHHDDHHH